MLVADTNNLLTDSRAYRGDKNIARGRKHGKDTV
jgi:hypothetical protein